MKKNLRIKFVVLFSMFLILSSCRTDLTDYENKANEARQKYISKQLNYEELKQQFPLVAEKVSGLKKLTKSNGSNSRIYTDAVDEFTIDTEKSLYIEDEKGVKTYTFEVSTPESTSEILENLVLKDIGNNEFEAYIASYDKYAIENLTKLSLEEYKGHVSLIQLGNKKGSDIFGKYMANSCTMSTMLEIMNTYVPGTLCGSPLHHNYAQFLNGACTDDTKPTPGYWDTIFIYTTADVCNGGGASSGEIATGPILGGSGGGTISTMSTPCKKALKTFNKNSLVSMEIQNLAPKVSETIEHGLSVMNNITSTSPNPTQVLTGGVEGGVDIPTNPTKPYLILAHTHNSSATGTSDTTYSVPSWEDLDKISEALSQNPNFADIDNLLVITITADGTRYAFMIENIDAFKNYFYIPNAANWDQDLSTKKAKNRNWYYYGDVVNGVRKEPLIKENSTNKEQDLKYFMEIANQSGLNVFEMDDSFTTFTQIKLTNNEIKRTECK